MKNSAGFVSDQRLTYSYDEAGNILSKNDTNGVLTETYTYDERNRLISASALNSPERSFTFEYDDFNNITKMVKNSVQKTYEYDDVKVHSLKTVREGTSYKTYTYNENGDVTLTVSPDAAREVVYDASNCVKSMTLTGTGKNKSWNYSYDSDGERIKKSFTDPETGKLMTTVYWFNDYEETFADDTLKKVSKLYGDYAQRVTEYELSDSAGSEPSTVDTLEFVFKDILGSPVCTVTAEGTIKNTFVYEPFGKMLDTANNNGASKSTTLLRSFTGHFAEDDEGLYYCHARWYDADIGRFLQADSVLDGFNRYAYCHNNPTGFVDPTGHKLEMYFDKSTQTLNVVLSDKHVNLFYTFGPNDVTSAVEHGGDRTKEEASYEKEEAGCSDEGNFTIKPKQFPNGEWEITGKTKDGKLTTNAEQTMIDQKTKEEKVDKGYQVHYSVYHNTWGCLGVLVKHIMKKLIQLWNMNTQCEDKSATIKVTGDPSNYGKDKTESKNTVNHGNSGNKGAEKNNKNVSDSKGAENEKN